MFCPNCGNKLDDGAAFCANCGCNLAEAAGDVSEDSAPSSSESGTDYVAYSAPETGPTYTTPTPETGSAYTTPPTPETDPTYTTPPTPGTSLSYDVPPTPVTSTPGAIPMRTDRDIVMYIVLSIVTCGIYSFWFVYQMAQDTNVMCSDDGKHTPGLAVYILLSIITCGIYSIYWQYQLAKRLDENAGRYGAVFQEHASDVLVWLLLGVFICNYIAFVATNTIINNLNAMSEAYNRANGLVYERV